MYFKLLGPLEVEDRERPMEIGGAKQRALLASLALNANKAVPRDHLIDLLWGEGAPASSAHRLEEHVSRLRKVLRRSDGASLETRAHGYLLRLGPEALDVAQFERLSDEGHVALRSERPEEAMTLLRRALALWRGRLLEDVALDRIAWPEVDRLEVRRTVSFEDLMDAALALGRHAEVLGELEVLVRNDPFRERLRVQLMLALYRAGRQADALAVYQDTRRAFAEELGIKPSPALKELEQAILRHDPSLELFQQGGRPLPPLPRASVGNLPRPASSFIGRDRELGEIISLLESGSRLITLTGAGGSGKTRLALEAGYRTAAKLPDGVFWVGLAPVRDARLVLDAAGQVLGAKEGGVASLIGDRRPLLIFDNLEQVLDAAVDLAALVEACPNLSVIVTSRQRLRVKGEVEYEVLPLDDSEAVELFCVRGRTSPDETVEELCRRLDNLPLAVEFAAARLSVMSPRQMLNRLAQRLDLLKGGRDAGRRQRTLRATIEWSHDLLSADEQRLFARLSIFAGGCTLEAAEAVAEAELDDLQSLVEKSLLRHRDERFWMLESIHEFALERLAESNEEEWIQRRCAAHFLALAREAETHFSAHRDESVWLGRLAQDDHNFHAVLSWAQQSGKGKLELRLATALGQTYWLTQGRYQEGFHRIFAPLNDNGDSAIRLRARASAAAARLTSKSGDVQQARRLHEQAAAYYREAGDNLGLANELVALLLFAGFDRREEEARALSNEIVSLRQHLGDAWAHVNARRLCNLGLHSFVAGRYAEARERLQAELALARSNNFERLTAQALCDLAFVDIADARYEEAWTSLVESLRRCRELGWKEHIAQCLEGFADLAAATGDLERAGRLLGAFETLMADVGLAHEPNDKLAYDRVIDRLNAAGAVRRELWLEQGRSLEIEEAMKYAFDSGGPGVQTSERVLSAI
ncbi:MAG TPA: BTAD domain-containing putative transcriptional regulator [Gaiellaceae bacterium]|nr:BTAD domain-containing putative transcriptional regulator [Gaiellaceae bacterium]